MRVLITGGRDWKHTEIVEAELNRFYGHHEITMLITGATPTKRGVDWAAFWWAMDREIPALMIPAKFKKYGNPAGPKRNRQMIKQRVDRVIAFPGGPGTDGMVRIAWECGVQVLDFREVYGHLK